MAEEVRKSTTTTKKKTTSKPQVEEPKTTSIEEQMAQMMAQQQQFMAMMMAQQQQFMETIQQAQQTQQSEKQMVQIEEEEEEKEKTRKPKRQRPENKQTKQQLRKKHKDTEIVLTNVTQGIVNYEGKNMKYHWENTGDSEVVDIGDIINMPKKYLHAPWLVIDGYENSEEVIDDIVNTLNLHDVYEYIDTIHDIHENINSVTLEDIERAIELSKKRGYDIRLDLTVLIQRKIDSKELTNFHMIGELEKLLGRKFL